MAKFKTDPANDQMLQVHWLQTGGGDERDKVIVSVDRPPFGGMPQCLRVVTSDGTEVVFFPEGARRESDPPVIQVFARPDLDELRERPDFELEGEFVSGNVLLGQRRLLRSRSRQFGNEAPGVSPDQLSDEALAQRVREDAAAEGVLMDDPPAGIEELAREMFPQAYARIDDEHPMPEELQRQVQLEHQRRTGIRPPLSEQERVMGVHPDREPADEVVRQSEEFADKLLPDVGPR